MADQRAEFRRDGPPNRIGYVDCSGTRIHHCLTNLQKKFRFGAGTIFWRKFDIIHKTFGLFDSLYRQPNNLVLSLAQFELPVNL